MAASMATAGVPLVRVLAITLMRSMKHHRPYQVANLRALGLHKPHQTVYHPNIPEVRGKVNKVRTEALLDFLCVADFLL